jgi:hypothetical protein
LLSKQLFNFSSFKNIRLVLVIGFIFAYTKEINTYILPSFLKAEFFSQNYIDYVEILENFIYIITGATLLQCINLLNIKKIIVFCFACFLLSIVNIFIVDIHDLVKINLLLLSIFSFVILATLIIQIIRINPGGIILFFISYFLGFICGLISIYFLKKNDLSVDISIIISISALSLLLSLFIKDIKQRSYMLWDLNFGHLINKLEIMLINGFIISYIFTNIYWQYDVWAAHEELAINDIQIIWLYMSIGSIVSTPMILLSLRKINKHFLNLLFGFALLISYIGFVYLKHDLVFTIFSSMTLGIALYGILICNVSIMTEQFERKILDSVIILFLTIFVLGGFFGIISAEKVLENTTIYTFPSYSLIIIYLTYYIAQFLNKRLYTR